MPTILEEATITFNELLRMHSLYQEMLETITLTMYQINNYAEKNKITLPSQEKILSLVSKSELLMQEITKRTFTNQLSDEISQRKLPDDNFTEPFPQLRNCFLALKRSLCDCFFWYAQVFKDFSYSFYGFLFVFRSYSFPNRNLHNWHTYYLKDFTHRLLHLSK